MKDTDYYAEYELSGLSKTLWLRQVADEVFPSWNKDFNSPLNALYFIAHSNEKADFAYRLAAGYAESKRDWYAFDDSIADNYSDSDE